MKMKMKSLVWAAALGFFITSCSSDDNVVEVVPKGDYEKGILVSNEGPFNNGTGTVTYISEDLATIEDAVFNKVNSADLGNIVQSIGFNDDKAYIIANVSNTINVVNRNTFEKVATITDGLNNPRYFVEANGKGYVTNWGDTTDETDDYIAIINLTDNTVEGNISVVLGPEHLLAQGEILYVAHKGAFGQNNKVSVINTTSNTVTTTINVGDVPNSMQFDDTGNLWVLCSGKPSFSGEETAGALVKVNTSTNEVATTMTFETTNHPSQLGIDGSMLYYYLGGSVFSLSTTADSLPSDSDFDELSFYSMTINKGMLYGTDAKDFASKGSLTIYDLSSKDLLKTLEVGIIPGGVYFNE
ncbi:putative surface layer protein [hydrothermal vent metagenome]|uniref:Putative surface layer protein n=1 Tax=hydrothermal vent metagenome TaxID=652676 RepID=A0A3B0SUT9_9ZZZZ